MTQIIFANGLFLFHKIRKMLLYLRLNEDLPQENYIAWIANEATGR